jgi:transposase-like protein
VASHLSKSRTLQAATAVLAETRGRVIGTPREILSDGLKAYPEAVERVFGADSKHAKSKGFTAEINTNLLNVFKAP